MRTLIKLDLPDVERATAAIQDGTLQRTLQSSLESLHPESAYFSTMAGQRGAYIVIDLENVFQIPVIAEPFFRNLNARVEFIPVMNLEELQTGLQQALA